MSNRQYIHLQPSNQPVDRKIGYSKGTPLVNFTLGESSTTALLGSTVRINGKINFLDSSGAKLVVNKALTNARLGVMAALDMITISTKLTNQTIEQIRFYNKFLSSYYSVSGSENELLGPMNCQMSSSNSRGVSQTGLIVRSGTESQSFSITLPTGLLLGQNPIPLTQGLIISLDLAPDSQVMTLFKKSDNAFETGTPSYELSDVTMTAEIVTGYKAPTKFLYNSISSYYNVINSAYATLSFNLGLSNVLGIWGVFVPSSHVNNYQHDGLQTLPLMMSDTSHAVPNQVQFLREGVAFPLHYLIDDRHADETTLFNPQIVRNYLSAIRNFRNITSTDMSPINTNQKMILTQTDEISGDIIYGIGVRYDTTSDQGADFQSKQFGLTISSDLTTNFPNSCYLFAHSRNTLIFGNGGVQVLN